VRPSSHAPVVLFGLAGAISDFINKLERDLGVDGSGLTVLFCIAVVVVIVLLLLYNRSSKKRALRRAHAGSFVAPDPFARSFHLQRSKATEAAPPDPVSVGPARDISNPRYRPDVELPSVADPVFPTLEEIRVAALGADKGSRVADDVFVGSGSGLGGPGSGPVGSGLGGPGSGPVGSNPLIPKAVGPGRLGPNIRGSDELGASQLGSSPAFSIPGLPGLHDAGPTAPAAPTAERVSSDPVISGASVQGPVVAPDPIGHSGFPTLSDTRIAYGPAPSVPEGAGIAVATSAPVPGWYEDPTGGPGSLRYWDGNAWTARRSA
jgi:hypothetical protein